MVLKAEARDDDEKKGFCVGSRSVPRGVEAGEIAMGVLAALAWEREGCVSPDILGAAAGFHGMRRSGGSSARCVLHLQVTRDKPASLSASPKHKDGREG